ncbi:MAG: nitroreductase family protein [Bacilli bacterium]|nr:nitroreductase family protein [Bacilli bacterium]
MQRMTQYPLLQEIQNRWSARAFSTKAVDQDDLYALIEAATLAPSAMNEQPWRFILGDKPDDLSILKQALFPSNHDWAQHAPVLIALCSKKTTTFNGKENFYSRFDAGAAWAFLSLEANRRDLIAHAIGGFDKKMIHDHYVLDDDIEVVLMIAIGYGGDIKSLSEKYQEREKPGLRRPFMESILTK